MKKKIKTTAQLNRMLRRIISEYIRLRDMDKNGNCFCCSCGKKMKAFGTGQAQAGHFFSEKNFPNIRYNEINIHTQCSACNARGWNPLAYARYIETKYGLKHLNELEIEALRRPSIKFGSDDLTAIISSYKEKIEKVRLN